MGRILFLLCMACVVLCASTVPVLAAAGLEIVPEMPDGFGFDCSELFSSLLEVIMPGIAAAIGFAASVWGISLLWRKIRSVAG